MGGLQNIKSLGNSTALADITNKWYPDSNQNIDIDIERFTEVYPQTLLAIPSYVEDAKNELVHPTLLYFPNGWNGYKYWMCATPYPSAQSAYENPSMYVSNDCITWIVLSGVTNPIEAKPAGSAYNSDPTLFMMPDGITMCLVIKVSGEEESERFYLKTTTNGINWTTRQLIFGTLASAEQNVSPSFWWDGSQWYMFSINILPATNVLQYRTCATLDGTWSEAIVCNIANVPTGKEPWHFEIRKYKNVYIMLINYMTTGGSSNGILRFAWSPDGVNWASSSQTVAYANTTSLYKSSFILVQEGNLIKAKILMGKASDYLIYYKEVIFSPKPSYSALEAKKQYNLDLFSGINNLAPAVFGDTFTRADSASSLGVASSGQTWTTASGTFGISGNKAYLPSDAGSKGIVDIGISDFKAGVEFSSLNNESWFLFRYVDGNNFFRFGCTGANAADNRYTCQSVIGGSVVTLTLNISSNTTTNLYNYVAAANDKVEVECMGRLINLYINGELVAYTTHASLTTATKIGIQASKAGVMFDNAYARKVF